MNLEWKPPTLETNRLLLRPVTEADAPAIFAYASNPAVTRFTLFETHQTIDDSRWFITEYAKSLYASQEPEPFALVLKDDPLRTMIGSLGAHWASHANGTMEFGYALAEPYWGRGLMVEAATALIRFVFAEYAVERLQARVLVGNAASERVLQKLGFMKEGVLRRSLLRRAQWWDLAMYSLVRAEWDCR